MKNKSTNKTAPVHADSREALLAAAKKVFAQKGFEGATVKDLSDEAGVNVSLVSYHFGGKEGLYRTALETFGYERVDVAERVLRTPGSNDEFKTRLRLFAEDFIDIHFRDPDTCRIIHRGIDSMDAITLDVFKSVFVRIFDAFHEFLASSQKAGLIRKELDAEIVASLMFGSLMHCVRSTSLVKAIGKRSLDQNKYREHFISHWVQTNTEGIFKP